MMAMLVNATMSPARIIFPASQFRGDSALGSLSMDVMALHAELSDQAGVQSFFSTSTQISPVLKCTLDEISSSRSV